MHLRRLTLAFGLLAASVIGAAAEEYKWGAIALDKSEATREPYYGVGGGDTGDEANENAMGFCKEAGGTACEVVITYEQCAALAVSGDGKGGWGTSATKEEAEAQSLQGCKGAACKVVVSDCNSGN